MNMPRRGSNSMDEEPPRKKSSSAINTNIDLKQKIVTDINGKKWKLGKPIGIGGFGEIYQASDDLSREVKTESPYVVKVERHSSGPLFVEINCYLRIGKSEMIEEWKKERKLTHLGMPYYVASGSHFYRGEKYRFLVMPRYGNSLEQIFQQKKVFNLKTVLTISTQIMDVLEYIHSMGYVHSDIKASNIMLGRKVKSKTFPQPKYLPRTTRKKTKRCSRRNLRCVGPVTYLDDIPYLDEVLDMHEKHETSIDFPKADVALDSNNTSDQVYLVDYGLASKFLWSNGELRNFSTDERRAHAGTVLFCSRDAHKGVPSRRSDLESLAYNMVYWLIRSLPWIDDLEQPEVVEKKKIRCLRDPKCFLEVCFNHDYPTVLLEYFNYLNELEFEEIPNYKFCRSLFKKAIKHFGYKDDSKLDFDNLEGWGSKQKKIKPKVSGSENRNMLRYSFLKTSPLMPLHSNIIFKRPKLRKKIKNKKMQNSMMNWSKILMDPETILKQAYRERKHTEGSDPGTANISAMDIESMNPTYAMWEVFNKCKERDISPRHKGDSGLGNNIEGYTPAMMSVYTRMKERQELEFEVAVDNYNNNKVVCKISRGSVKKRGQRRIKRSESPSVQRASSRAKSQIHVLQKKESVPLRKVKSVPIRRTYSLRG